VELAPGSSFVNGDTLASLDLQNLWCSVAAYSFSPARTYPITPYGVRSDNYTITYRTGTLTVTP
jgi:hypothetical protein